MKYDNIKLNSLKYTKLSNEKKLELIREKIKKIFNEKNEKHQITIVYKGKRKKINKKNLGLLRDLADRERSLEKKLKDKQIQEKLKRREEEIKRKKEEIKKIKKERNEFLELPGIFPGFVPAEASIRDFPKKPSKRINVIKCYIEKELYSSEKTNEELLGDIIDRYSYVISALRLSKNNSDLLETKEYLKKEYDRVIATIPKKREVFENMLKDVMNRLSKPIYPLELKDSEVLQYIIDEELSDLFYLIMSPENKVKKLKEKIGYFEDLIKENGSTSELENAVAYLNNYIAIEKKNIMSVEPENNPIVVYPIFPDTDKEVSIKEIFNDLLEIDSYESRTLEEKEELLKTYKKQLTDYISENGSSAETDEAMDYLNDLSEKLYVEIISQNVQRQLDDEDEEEKKDKKGIFALLAGLPLIKKLKSSHIEKIWSEKHRQMKRRFAAAACASIIAFTGFVGIKNASQNNSDDLNTQTNITEVNNDKDNKKTEEDNKKNDEEVIKEEPKVENSISFDDVVTIKENSPIYTNSYDATYNTNEYDPLYDGSYEREVEAVSYEIDGKVYTIFETEENAKEKVDMLIKSGANLSAVLVTRTDLVNGVTHEGYYDSDNVNVKVRMR